MHNYSNHIFLQGSWWRLTPYYILYRRLTVPIVPVRSPWYVQCTFNTLDGFTAPSLAESDCAHASKTPKKNTPNQTLNGTHAWLDAFLFGFGPVFSQQSIPGSCICPTEVLAALKLDNCVLLSPLLHHCCNTAHCLHLKIMDVSVKLTDRKNLNPTACIYHRHLSVTFCLNSFGPNHSHPVAGPLKRFWALLLLDTKDKIEVNGLSFSILETPNWFQPMEKLKKTQWDVNYDSSALNPYSKGYSNSMYIIHPGSRRNYKSGEVIPVSQDDDLSTLLRPAMLFAHADSFKYHFGFSSHVAPMLLKLSTSLWSHQSWTLLDPIGSEFKKPVVVCRPSKGILRH